MRTIGKSEKIVNNQTLHVAVDVSKDKNTGYFRCPDGRAVKPSLRFKRIGAPVF